MQKSAVPRVDTTGKLVRLNGFFDFIYLFGLLKWQEPKRKI
jgi:hypothetical protein